ncbi:hypothetical protein LTR84_010506 [Exophiala bonariae]|uniref:SET domain-containing protein n=1 Tax=Exophiala bonariae TaxID=1690606 RepID=A0AAV9MTH9_9EURO|nr:hypothetical protein LTR84_010506 [Exophiala bonariae]
MSAPSSTAAPPKNWPSSVTYLTKPHIPPHLAASAIQISTPGPYVTITPLPKTPSTLVRITPITTPCHPAHGQAGLFASTALGPDSFILFYLGAVHDSSTTDPTSDYDLSLDRELDLSVDATRYGNEARFINDYRGVRAEGPNAEFRDCVVQVATGRWERRIGVFVLSRGRGKGGRALGIKKGEEIVVSYGKGFWDARRVEADVGAVADGVS